MKINLAVCTYRRRLVVDRRDKPNDNKPKTRNTKMKKTINTTTENGETRIIDMIGSPHNQNVSVWDSTGAAESIWSYESGLDLLQNHPEDLVLNDEQIEALKQFEPLTIESWQI